MMYGIDISRHNGDIDLEEYKDGFVIIRVGYGSFTLDEKFERNVNECKRLGIPFGVYIYSYALNTEDARAEAEAVIEALKPYKNDIKVGVWFDMEDADGYKERHGMDITAENVSNICYEFCDRVEAEGYYTGIYCSESWLKYLTDECDRFDKWVANWGPNDGELYKDTSDLGTLHQYTSNPIDKNVMYVDISTYDMGAGEPANPLDAYSDEELASKVMAGEFGNGADRKLALGSRYDSVQAIVNGCLASTGSEAIKVGDKVTVLRAVNYDTGGSFKLWHDLYDVMELNGDRAVIGVNGEVTSAINVANLKRY